MVFANSYENWNVGMSSKTALNIRLALPQTCRME